MRDLLQGHRKESLRVNRSAASLSSIVVTFASRIMAIMAVGATVCAIGCMSTQFCNTNGGRALLRTNENVWVTKSGTHIRVVDVRDSNSLICRTFYRNDMFRSRSYYEQGMPRVTESDEDGDGFAESLTIHSSYDPGDMMIYVRNRSWETIKIEHVLWPKCLDVRGERSGLD